MSLNPTNQFLFDCFTASMDDLAELSNKLMTEACIVGADRGELCRKILLVDAIGNFRFPDDYAPQRRRLAA